MGDFLTGILSGIVGTALISLAFVMIRKIRAWQRFRPFHNLWLPFTQESSVVVLTGKREGHTIKVSMNESQSAQAIQMLIGTSNCLPMAISSHDHVSLEGKNVIALGSVPANEVTRALLQSLDGRLSYNYTADKDLVVNGELFRSQYRNNVLVRDYALICKAPNPFSPDHKFLVFSGNHGIGTQGGVLAVTSIEGINKIVRTIGGADFFAVVETTSDSRFQELPTKVRVIRCSLLAAARPERITTVLRTRETRLRALIVKIGGNDNYLQHAGAVAKLAVGIANTIQSRGTEVDIDAVYFGAMLHDIGRTLTDGIDHGVRGAEIIQQYQRELISDFALPTDTIERIEESVECHIVGGIPLQWIQSSRLAIPEKDYIPHSLEGKLVALSDQLLHHRHQDVSILREAPILDIEVLKRIFGLTTEIIQVAFGSTDQDVATADDANILGPALRG